MSVEALTRTTEQVANRLVELCREGKSEEAVKELYHQDITSLEAAGSENETFYEGLEEVAQKSAEWYDSIEEFHGSVISDPIIVDGFFSVTMQMDVTFKEGGRANMDELCVYEVEDGKIIAESFYYQTA